jgi:hypothetical protein
MITISGAPKLCASTPRRLALIVTGLWAKLFPALRKADRLA